MNRGSPAWRKPRSSSAIRAIGRGRFHRAAPYVSGLVFGHSERGSPALQGVRQGRRETSDAHRSNHRRVRQCSRSWRSCCRGCPDMLRAASTARSGPGRARRRRRPARRERCCRSPSSHRARPPTRARRRGARGAPRPPGPGGPNGDSAAGLQMRIALLRNPDSGSGQAGDVAGLLRAAGAEVDEFGLDEADRAVAAHPDRIAVAGGDGSLGCAAAAAVSAGGPAGRGPGRHRQRLRAGDGPARAIPPTPPPWRRPASARAIIDLGRMEIGRS